MKHLWLSGRACLCLVLFLCFFSTILIAQQPRAEITGIVRNESGNSLAHVTVLLKNDKINFTASTQTDSVGVFNFSNLPAGADYSLTFSTVGYESQTIRNYALKTVGNFSIVVKLKEHIQSMDQVVVVGYGTTSRRNLTTAISTVDPKNVPQAANSSVSQLLFGRAAGLKVTQASAEPGGNINLSIRGRVDNPVIVIDGVIMPYSSLEAGNSNIANELNNVRRGGFAGISPDDIESIEVLKDASASIYGVNAAGGAVIITTKRGKAGKIRVNYDGSHSVVTNMKYLQPLTAREYMINYNQLTLDRFLADSSMAPFGNKAPDLSKYPGRFSPFTDQQIATAGVGTDWLEQVLRTGSIDNHSVSLSGGADKMTYYMSGTYFDQKGTVKNSGMKRYTGKVNVTYNLTSFLTLNADLSGARSFFSNPQSGWSSGGAGSQAFNAVQAAVSYPAYLPVYDANGAFTRFANTGNPVSLLDIKDNTVYTSLFTNLSMDVKIIRNILTGRVSYGNTYETSTRDFFVPKSTFYFEQNTARASLNESKRQWTTMEATLSFKKSFFQDNLKVDAVGGIGQYPKNEYGFGAAGANMLDPINTANLAAATSQLTITSYKNAAKQRSYFARTSFDIFNRYVVQLSYRYDGYSGFFPENKYAAFPSASLGWKLNNESFLKDIKAINLLKLRGSIGITGSIPSNFLGSAYAAFVPDNYLIAFNSGATGYIPYTLSNVDRPALSWPKTTMKNIGLDFSVFNDRISGSFDYFKEDITRLLTNASTLPLDFLATQPINAGHQARKGWEVALNTANIKSKSFQWTSSINVSHYDFRWKEQFPNFVNATYNGKTYTQTNDPVNSVYVFKTNGLLQVGQQVPVWQPSKANLPGSPVFVDVNDDKLLDGNDIIRYTTNPDINIGLGNIINYRQFDFSFFFYGQFGSYGFNQLISWTDPTSIITTRIAGIKEAKDVWTSTNQSGIYPGVAYNEATLALPVSTDVRLQKTDFVRCRNITVGYSFNTPAIKKYLQNLRIYGDVQNAFIITDFKIADPEVDSQGNRNGVAAPYPMARTFSVGVKATF